MRIENKRNEKAAHKIQPRADLPLMNVIVLTVFLGLVLVTFFVVMFLHQSAGPNGAGSERDALFPLQEDKASVIKTRKGKPTPPTHRA